MDSAFRVSLVLSVLAGIGWLGMTGYYTAVWVGRSMGHPRFTRGALAGARSSGWAVGYAFLIGMGVTAGLILVTLLVYLVRAVARALL